MRSKLLAGAVVMALVSTFWAAMSLLAHTDALIFDLRDNGGGDPRMVALIEIAV